PRLVRPAWWLSLRSSPEPGDGPDGSQSRTGSPTGQLTINRTPGHATNGAGCRSDRVEWGQVALASVVVVGGCLPASRLSPSLQMVVHRWAARPGRKDSVTCRGAGGPRSRPAGRPVICPRKP